MRIARCLRGECGQATVETLALVPLVVSVAVGLCAVGLWFEQRQANGAQLADATVRWLESGTSDRGNGKVRVKVTNGVAEAVSSSGQASLLGVSLTSGERLRWVEVAP
jgi:hypothetical protein